MNANDVISYWTMVWTAVGAGAQLITVVFLALAFVYSVWSFKRSVCIQHHDGLDQLYSELLRDAFGRPHLRDPDRIHSHDKKEQDDYNDYAYMVWNFIETIYDRIGNDKELHATWDPVVALEVTLHGKWFENPDHYKRYKKQFRDYVASIKVQNIRDPATTGLPMFDPSRLNDPLAAATAWTG